MERSTSRWHIKTSFIAQPCNIPVHFLAREMCVSLHPSAMDNSLSVFMIQRWCGRQTWHRAVSVYVYWSQVLLPMDHLLLTGLHFVARPLECWTAPPPSAHLPAGQNVKEWTLLRYCFDFFDSHLTRRHSRNMGCFLPTYKPGVSHLICHYPLYHALEIWMK